MTVDPRLVHDPGCTATHFSGGKPKVGCRACDYAAERLAASDEYIRPKYERRIVPTDEIRRQVMITDGNCKTCGGRGFTMSGFMGLTITVCPCLRVIRRAEGMPPGGTEPGPSSSATP